jgi:hypothetical protein
MNMNTPISPSSSTVTGNAAATAQVPTDSTATATTTTIAPLSAAASMDMDGDSSHETRSVLNSNAKRPLLTHSKDGEVLSEKRLRRLEKNRLSARECRRRKREATEHLQRQINRLEGENLRKKRSCGNKRG